MKGVLCLAVLLVSCSGLNSTPAVVPGDPASRPVVLVRAAGDLLWVLAEDPLTGKQTPFLRSGEGEWVIPGPVPNEVGFAALASDGFVALGDDDGIEVSLMVSNDGGASWTPRQPPGTSATYGLHLGTDGVLYTLFNHADRYLSYSADRGISWYRQKMPGWIDFRKLAEPAFVTGPQGELAVLMEQGVGLRLAGSHEFLYPEEVMDRRLGASVFLEDGAFLAGVSVTQPGQGEVWEGLWLRSQGGVASRPEAAGLPTESRPRLFLSQGQTVLAIFWNAVYRSVDRGDSWTPVTGGYPWELDPQATINDAALGQGALWVATSVGLVKVALS